MNGMHTSSAVSAALVPSKRELVWKQADHYWSGYRFCVSSGLGFIMAAIASLDSGGFMLGELVLAGLCCMVSSVFCLFSCATEEEKALLDTGDSSNGRT